MATAPVPDSALPFVVEKQLAALSPKRDGLLARLKALNGADWTLVLDPDSIYGKIPESARTSFARVLIEEYLRRIVEYLEDVCAEPAIRFAFVSKVTGNKFSVELDDADKRLVHKSVVRDGNLALVLNAEKWGTDPGQVGRDLQLFDDGIVLLVKKKINLGEEKKKAHLARINQVLGGQWQFETDWKPLCPAALLYGADIVGNIYDDLLGRLATKLVALAKDPILLEAMHLELTQQKIVFTITPGVKLQTAFVNGVLEVRSAQGSGFAEVGNDLDKNLLKPHPK